MKPLALFLADNGVAFFLAHIFSVVVPYFFGKDFPSYYAYAYAIVFGTSELFLSGHVKFSDWESVYYRTISFILAFVLLYEMIVSLVPGQFRTFSSEEALVISFVVALAIYTVKYFPFAEVFRRRRRCSLDYVVDYFSRCEGTPPNK